MRRGDTLGGIAIRLGTSVSAIQETNAIRNANRIYVGQVLKVPGDGAPRTAAPATPAPTAATDAFHTVRRGEALSTIAGRYGVSTSTLAAANGISNPNRIRVGQSLRVPGAGGSTSSGLACPVPGGRYLDDFGYVKPSGSVHMGIDIFDSRGTPVFAPVDGVATHVTGPRAGLQVTFDGDDGARYYLTHLDSFGTSGRVSAGTQIGTVGNTGNARYTSPHVHFERHVDGEASNPFGWLNSAC